MSFTLMKQGDVSTWPGAVGNQSGYRLETVLIGRNRLRSSHFTTLFPSNPAHNESNYFLQLKYN